MSPINRTTLGLLSGWHPMETLPALAALTNLEAAAQPRRIKRGAALRYIYRKENADESSRRKHHLRINTPGYFVFFFSSTALVFGIPLPNPNSNTHTHTIRCKALHPLSHNVGFLQG